MPGFNLYFHQNVVPSAVRKAAFGSPTVSVSNPTSLTNVGLTPESGNVGSVFGIQNGLIYYLHIRTPATHCSLRSINLVTGANVLINSTDLNQDAQWAVIDQNNTARCLVANWTNNNVLAINLTTGASSIFAAVGDNLSGIGYDNLGRLFVLGTGGILYQLNPLTGALLGTGAAPGGFLMHELHCNPADGFMYCTGLQINPGPVIYQYDPGTLAQTGVQIQVIASAFVSCIGFGFDGLGGCVAFASGGLNTCSATQIPAGAPIQLTLMGGPPNVFNCIFGPPDPPNPNIDQRTLSPIGLPSLDCIGQRRTFKQINCGRNMTWPI